MQTQKIYMLKCHRVKAMAVISHGFEYWTLTKEYTKITENKELCLLKFIAGYRMS
jgi:hypothetical protein